MEGDFYVEPMCVLDKREVVLQKQTIVQVKDKWKHYALEDATWEREDVMKQAYPVSISRLIKLNSH